MRCAAVATIGLLAGCNDLLELGEPTHAPVDPTRPSYATGWLFRAPIVVTNASGHALADYQLRVSLDTRSLIDGAELQATAQDLRFATGDDEPALAYEIESGLNTASTLVWVNVPVIPVGDSEIYAYWGNPVAARVITSPFVQGVIANPSFEVAGGWNVQSVGTRATVWIDDLTWHTDGLGSVAMDEEIAGTRDGAVYTQITQDVTFPPGSEYRIRFDVEVIAASYGPGNGGGFFVTTGNDLDFLWTLGGHSNVTGAHLGNETGPVSAGTVSLALGTSVDGGSDHGYAKGAFDHLRLRKSVTPEPTTTVGGEQAADP